MVELLKQVQYATMPVMDQVISIYAGTRGFLDDIYLDDVREFERNLLLAIKSQHKDFYDQLTSAKVLSDADKAKLDEIIKAFKGTLKNRKQGGAAE
jgi:F-type H+-transporting ATPase subunit alpha